MRSRNEAVKRLGQLGVDRKNARVLVQAGIVSQNDIAGLTDTAALELVLRTDLDMGQVLEWRKTARSAIGVGHADRELVRGRLTGVAEHP